MEPTNQQQTEEEKEAAKERERLITLNGGVELEVNRRDGMKELIKVRQIPISKIQPLSIAVGFGNMADAIELYCDKDKGWADGLEYDSALAIMEKGTEMNLPFFEAWLKDQAKWRNAFVIAKDNTETQSASR